jgi:aromatic ring-opening dioxygenase catalytic subunit (LigB family)
MADLAVAATVSHAPAITGRPELGGEQAVRYYAGMAKIRAAFEEAKPDVIVEIFTDHFTNFYLDNMPAICVGVAPEYVGPAEPEEFLRVPKVTVRGHKELSWALVRAAYDSGFDVSFSHRLVLDHGAMVPLHFVTPSMNLPIVPVIVNVVAEPMPSPGRVYHLGAMIRQVIASRPKNERVALLGTGGLSHWVGTPEMGLINVDFDERFLEAAEKGKGKSLAELTPEKIGKAGNGAHEVRNWIAVFGALGGIKGEITTYEAVVPWFCGCGGVLFRT